MFVLVVILIVLYLIQQMRKPPNFPPGPRWLPIVGSTPELKKLSRALGGQHLALIDLAKTYNTNVLGLKLGNEYVISVFSYKTIREVLTSEVYEGRPDNFFLRLRCMGTRKGITCTDGEFWSVQRNFVVRHLRNLGFGKKVMEEMILKEVSQILGYLQDNGAQVHIGKVLAPAVLNILWTLTTGSGISKQNSRLDKLLDLLELRSKAFDMSGGVLNQYPWLRFVIPEKSGFNLIKHMNGELKELLMDTIKEHHENWSSGRSDDLIYSFISEMKQSNAGFTDDQLVMVCLDLFIAGAQTTSNTLNFAFLMMILHPEVQLRVQEQIRRVLNEDEIIDHLDKQRLPYVEAVLLEVQRFCHVTPVIGPRRVLNDTTLEGYFIPKNSTVLINLFSVNNDKEFWSDPENFRPERFLDESGSLISQEKLILFGLGRRRCLGEALAKNCIFLFFVEILRRYSVVLASGTKRPSGRPLPGITLSPEYYIAKFLKQ